MCADVVYVRPAVWSLYTHLYFFFFFSPLQANAASVENKCKVTAAMVIVIMTAQKAHSR